MEATQSQDRSAFHEERRRMIGGSDAPACVGESPFKGAYQVWAEKSGLVPPDNLEGEHLELGLVIEPYMAGKYMREHPGITVIGAKDLPGGGLCMHPTIPWMGCHLDAEIHGDRRGVGTLQIKSTGFDDEEWRTGVPDHVYIQTLYEMECRRATWGVVGVLFGAPLLHTRFIELEPNPELMEAVMDACAELWRRVENGGPPPARGMDIPTLKTMFSNIYAGADDLELGEAGLALHTKRTAAAARAKAAIEEKDDATAELLRMLGPNGRGKLPGKLGVYRRKLINKDAHHVAASSYIEMRLVKN